MKERTKKKLEKYTHENFNAYFDSVREQNTELSEQQKRIE